MTVVPIRVIEELRRHAESECPHECCGLLLGSGNLVVRARPCRNAQDEMRAAEPERFARSSWTAFLIAPEDQLAVMREARESGLDIMAAYHSHVDRGAHFSETDRRMAALWPALLHVVVGVVQGRAGGIRCFDHEGRERPLAITPG